MHALVVNYIVVRILHFGVRLCCVQLTILYVHATASHSARALTQVHPTFILYLYFLAYLVGGLCNEGIYTARLIIASNQTSILSVQPSGHALKACKRPNNNDCNSDSCDHNCSITHLCMCIRCGQSAFILGLYSQ